MPPATFDDVCALLVQEIVDQTTYDITFVMFGIIGFGNPTRPSRADGRIRPCAL
ncbi:hypothetical protein [Nocardia abscessus]|uniref:hypothetical protein n=1 Tax=Nocardia abscessus TaxID=120957 RepID=UPI0002D4820E|nr:hypothetical protein [Nocardia abscessus]MCC3332988.1 hypothetical protein [Nocardia abscessus]